MSRSVLVLRVLQLFVAAGLAGNQLATRDEPRQRRLSACQFFDNTLQEAWKTLPRALAVRKLLICFFFFFFNLISLFLITRSFLIARSMSYHSKKDMQRPELEAGAGLRVWDEFVSDCQILEVKETSSPLVFFFWNPSSCSSLCCKEGFLIWKAKSFVGFSL